MTQKKKSPKIQQDETTLKIPNIYKRKCQSNGVGVNKILKEKLDQAIQDGKLQILQIWEELGPIQIRSLMESFIDLDYQHLKKIRLWKVNVQDQGLRTICKYIQKSNTIQYLDLMDNHITSLGCQFLGKVLSIPGNRINKLKLDNNPIGSNGLKNLSIGLRQNSTIQKLSFNYCNLDQTGIIYIQEILANINCKLRTIKIQGNNIGNQGCYQLLRAISICGEKLQKLNISDCGMNLLNYKIQIGNTIQQKITKQIINIIQTNNNLVKYNFKNNFIHNDIAKLIIDNVKQNKNIFIIQLPDCIVHQLKQLHAEIMKKRKPKKKKKKNNKKNKVK